MHSSNRTLIASLGFADPDKKNPLHDIACQYLAIADNAYQVISSLRIPQPTAEEAFELNGKQGAYKRESTGRPRFCIGNPEYELMLSKGEGQYRTHIGFIDLTIPFQAITPIAITEFRPNKYVDMRNKIPWEQFSVVSKEDGNWTLRSTVAIEVKIGQVPIGDVLRQIRLYQMHARFGMDYWLLATAYSISVEDAAVLQGAGIYHVKLGEKFDAYAAQRQWEPDADSLEI